MADPEPLAFCIKLKQLLSVLVKSFLCEVQNFNLYFKKYMAFGVMKIYIVFVLE
jgi:hypothetical protein